jgi:hypothetical protein
MPVSFQLPASSFQPDQSEPSSARVEGPALSERADARGSKGFQ